jgi:hypothetical protein
MSAFVAWRLANGSDPQALPANIPGSAAELAMHLRDRLPGARIVATRADGALDRSFFLTVGDTGEEALRKLPRAVDRVGQWRGVVLCEWLVNGEETQVLLDEWGEHAYVRPPFVFFGDKELLARIEEALR